MSTTLRVATRGSTLARWQADHVAELIRAAEPDLDIEIVTIETHADRHLEVPIWEMGGKGVFVKEVQAAVLDGRADVAVHSAKDLPAVTPDGLVIAAIPRRADARDALVGASLDALPEGACVATGSLRRRAQLAHQRPDLRFEGLRGNMTTRLAHLDDSDIDAIVVAAAALDRLGLGHRIGERLGVTTMLPQVGQAALAVECRADDQDTRSVLERTEHGPSRRTVMAERGFLAELGGDCSLPAAAHATLAGDSLHLRGLVASADGALVVRHGVDGPAAAGAALGRSVARHLLDEKGGRKLLADG